jgi:electron transfer flavoprotein alpha subunit
VDGAGGAGGAAGGGLTHQILADTEAPGAGESHHVEAVEVLDAPSAGDLVDSRFLVVAGSGAGSREGVERIAAAAARMGAAFGATRPVVMNGWAPMDRLVGVSGSRAAPSVCLVVGASGAPALHWGIERARFLAAVNLDEHAPIVENADAALVDDGVTVMEELARIVEARRENG